MTSQVTEREVVIPGQGGPRSLDSPPTRAGARARVATADSKRKAPAVGLWRTKARTGLRRWWVWTDRPASLRVAWKLTAVSPSRIPAGSGLLALIWRWSNRTDRLLMFALIMVAPTALTGPLRWLAARPTRRWAMYVIVGALAAGTLIH